MSYSGLSDVVLATRGSVAIVVFATDAQIQVRRVVGTGSII